MGRVNRAVKRSFKSIWTFPIFLTLLFLLFVIFGINGSSIGIYNKYFYGSHNDPDLIALQPRNIRSDEYIVDTQLTLAQANSGFEGVNKNIGDGENITLLSDAPSNDWSAFFKPQNAGFILLPFDNAYAFRWWFLGYLLILAVYTVTLLLLKQSRPWLAALISVGFYFSPFIQWWYRSITIGPLAYMLLAIAIFTVLMNTRKWRFRIPLTIALAYIGTAFAFIFYPPFQIPCAIVGVLFMVGLLLERRHELVRPRLRYFVASIIAAAVLCGGITLTYIETNKTVISTVNNTVYPGRRVVQSGGYNPVHFFASSLGGLLQNDVRAANYSIPASNAVNQSEDSNFILLLPFVLPVIIFFACVQYQKRRTISYTTIAIVICSILFLAWLFIPSLSVIGKITFLDKVPLARLTIGFGLLNILSVITMIRMVNERKLYKLPHIYTLFYVLICCSILLVFHFLAIRLNPAFASLKVASLLAVPVPLVIYLFMRRLPVAAAAVLLVFSFASSAFVNPIYEGTSILRKNPLVHAIQDNGDNDNERWISEDINIENFAWMSGERSLTGVYLYPQASVWSSLEGIAPASTYNRYAHVNFTFDRTGTDVSPIMTLVRPDQFNVRINPCDSFFKRESVKHLVTSVAFPDGAARCASLAQKVTFPNITFYIYSLNL